MTVLLSLSAALMAVVAAARSTWSPCGVSMLATITPLAERARGHRYRTTASWFVAGSLVGGASLGVGMAALAAVIGAAGPSATVLAALACGASLAAAAADARLAGFRVPVHHRQVNERWLDQFRPWVYGAGFGWQIGAGVVTYIKSSAVYLMIVLAALTGDPWIAAAIGAVFGLVRGLAVLLGRGITNGHNLAEFHRRFTAFEPVVLAVVVASEVALALLNASLVSLWAALVLAALSGAVALGRIRQRGTAPAPAPSLSSAGAQPTDR